MSIWYMLVLLNKDCEVNWSIAINFNKIISEPMSANNATGIYIPSVFVSDDTGLILAQKYQYEEDYYIVLNDDLPFNINTTLVLPFAIVVGICFVVMVIFMVSNFVLFCGYISKIENNWVQGVIVAVIRSLLLTQQAQCLC